MTEKTIPVFFHSSNEFCPYMATTMASILYNTRSFIEFNVIETGISAFNKKRIELLKEQFPNFSVNWIKFEYNDIFKKEYFERLKPFAQQNQWPGIHGFATPFMPLLRPEYDKIIYLDSDIIFLGDIQNLFDINLDEYPLAAAPEVVIPLYVDELIEEKNKNINYKEYGKYFNAGLLLVNAKQFRERNYIEKYFEYASSEIMQIADQDVLNRLFGPDNFKRLDLKYNFIYMPTKQQLERKHISGRYQEFEEAKRNIQVRHFADKKPWNSIRENWSQTEILCQNEFWFFAKLTPFFEGIEKIREAELYKSLQETGNTILRHWNYTPQTFVLKLFKFITLLTVKQFDCYIKIYLFGKIHILTIYKHIRG